MRELTSQPLFGVAVTITVFLLARALYQRTRWMLANPVAVSIVVLIVLLESADVPYDAYARGGDLLLFLLGPAVVALALPLYQRRDEVVRRALPIAAGLLVGAGVSVASASGLAWLLGASDDVVRSLAPKSVTTPIAIGISREIGGIPPLTACIVVATGCLGALAGPELCRWLGVRDPAAQGLAVGTASHGIGTARMLEEDRLAGAVAGLAIGLNGLLTAAFLPWLFDRL